MKNIGPWRGLSSESRKIRSLPPAPSGSGKGVPKIDGRLSYAIIYGPYQLPLEQFPFSRTSTEAA
jgi:hypothetical protein